MRKPWVIGVLSIIPGLGLLALGGVLQGFTVMVLFAIFAAGAALSPWETLSTWSLAFALVVWIAQLVYAITFSKRMALLEQEGLAATPAPSEASFGERYRLGEIAASRHVLTPLLEPGESLRVALLGQTGTPPLLWGVIRAVFQDNTLHSDVEQVCLGASEQDFLLMPDPVSRPGEIQRIPLSKVELVRSSEGLLLDDISLDFGQTTPFRVQLPRRMRPETRQLMSLLSGKEKTGNAAWETARRGIVNRSGKPTALTGATTPQGRHARHPILLAAQLGAGGGIAGSIVGAVLMFIAGMIDCSIPGRGVDCGEGWGYLIGFYCLVLFPVGGAFLGAVPGAGLGWLRKIRDEPPALRPPFLAGFLAVVGLTLAGLGVIFLSYFM